MLKITKNYYVISLDLYFKAFSCDVNFIFVDKIT
jgi:hypothetical protein